MSIAGLTAVASSFGFNETLHRLDTAVRASGMTVFARIDHAAGARQAGLELRPTTLLIFGNARAGTPLMQAAQTLGIDLPLRALIWDDELGKTWLSYNEPAWLAARHGLDPEKYPSVAAITKAIATVATRAARAE
jgi:uncharacterized protein (DUF302 family)